MKLRFGEWKNFKNPFFRLLRYSQLFLRRFWKSTDTGSNRGSKILKVICWFCLSTAFCLHASERNFSRYVWRKWQRATAEAPLSQKQLSLFGKPKKKTGFAPEDVDFVLCTHLHVDHVGWNTRLLNGKWVPTFPRAQYLFCRGEWDFWNQEYLREGFADDPYYEDSKLLIMDAGVAKIIICNYVIDDWVKLSPSPGHTPGHICVELGRGTLKAIMTGDIMHHPIKCSEPQLNSCFCVDPKLSEKTRRALIKRFRGEPTLIMPAHFPCPSAGRFVAFGTET